LDRGQLHQRPGKHLSTFNQQLDKQNRQQGQHQQQDQLEEQHQSTLAEQHPEQHLEEYQSTCPDQIQVGYFYLLIFLV
jgi:hypothetical protein